jgi:hypothetical protein
MSRVLTWLFDSLVVPLLSTSFYATESGAQRNQTFYYRRPGARALLSRRIAVVSTCAVCARACSLASRGRRVASQRAARRCTIRVGAAKCRHRHHGRTRARARISCASLTRASQARRGFAFGFARLLPKRGGRVRPIVNLARKPSALELALLKQVSVSHACACNDIARVQGKGYATSINAALSCAHRVLQAETRAVPGMRPTTFVREIVMLRMQSRLVPLSRHGMRSTRAWYVYECSCDGLSRYVRTHTHTRARARYRSYRSGAPPAALHSTWRRSM